jgi:hypothetical protein
MPVYLQSTSGVAQQGIKILLYGRSGVGKTRLSASAPAPVIFSAESGLLSLRQNNLPYSQINSYQDLVDAYYWSVQSQEAQQFGTVVLDSISEIAEVILKDARKNHKDPRKAYGDVLDQTINMVRLFRDIPYKNVVIIAKEEWQKDEQTGIMQYGPMFPGSKLGPQMPYFFDEVFRYIVGTDPTTKQEWAALQTRADMQSVAKDRSGVLQPYELPDLGSIINRINGVA